MKKSLLTTLHIDTDNSETKRVLFPGSMVYQAASWMTARRIQVVAPKQKVDLRQWGADYLPTHHRELVGFETKRSFSEIRGNFGSVDRYRQYDSLARLADRVKHPYLVLDFGWEQWNKRLHAIKGEKPIEHGRIMDWILTHAVAFKLGIIGPIPGNTIRTRTLLGEQMARIMMAHVEGAASADILTERPQRDTRKKMLDKALDAAQNMGVDTDRTACTVQPQRPRTEKSNGGGAHAPFTVWVAGQRAGH